MTNQSDSQLAGQVAIVTGGSSGIGRATCHALARQGAHVVVVDLDQGRINDVVAELARPAGDGLAHLGLAGNVGSERDMQDMAERTIERFERIDMLVTCAGILRGKGSPPKPLAQIATDEWDQVIDTNLKGMFLSNRAVLPAMSKQRQGNIVNVSSVSGKEGRAHDAPYCASKFGVIGMSESLAEEVRNQGIRVQILCPDAVATPFWEQNAPVPMPTTALAPERIADLIVFMLTLPEDTMLVSPVIAPFRTRRRGPGKTPAA
jgi:NAD(P)-dependent dehydrogenase (short-subunit alcohol dehydrogenase family)